ncbi:helix-turn-helix domain-containing protein [Streptomyces boninensis]|uniref:helix-turn-helix domain-containing protein n=1 Tax=Streptomyces boninensis TaxID=2039455 RepID=UPI003B21D421
MSIGNSPTDDRPSVGRTLQRARIDAKLTVDEVSTQTRVRIPIVHAIEQDDFSRCGGDVYARGHVRTLARAVGLDPSELVAQYDEEHGGKPEPTPAAPLFEAERIRPEPRRPNWTAAMVAAIVALIGFVGFTVFSDGGGDNPKASDSKTDDKPAPKPSDSTSRPPAEPSPSDSAIAGAPADRVTVKVEADNGQSWLLAKGADGRELKQTTLTQGDSVTVSDKEKINLTLGNAGAIKLWVNGKEVDNDFKLGGVEHLTYTKGDPEAG